MDEKLGKLSDGEEMSPSPPGGCGAVVDWLSSVDESEGAGFPFSSQVSPLLLSQPVFLVQSSVKKYSL